MPPMSPLDAAALTTSALALALSIVSAVLGYRERRALRAERRFAANVRAIAAATTLPIDVSPRGPGHARE